MKSILYTFILIFTVSFSSMGQTFSEDSIITQSKIADKYSQAEKDSILYHMIPLYLDNIEFILSKENRYKLYPTENMYTFLKLDTKTGKIDQVHWSLEQEKEYIVTLNDQNLNYFGESNFELIPTKNMYQFILINTRIGTCYHVQWNFDPEKRGLRRIY